MSRGLAYRRWKAEQARVRTRRIWSDWGMFRSGWAEDEIEQWVVRMAQCGNRPCSRPWCCGNPRRGPGGIDQRLTRQERRAHQEPLDALYEQWVESLHDYDWDDGWLWVPPHVRWWLDYQGAPKWKRDLYLISRT